MKFMIKLQFDDVQMAPLLTDDKVIQHTLPHLKIILPMAIYTFIAYFHSYTSVETDNKHHNWQQQNKPDGGSCQSAYQAV